MSKEKDRLIAMVNQGKISAEDFKLLSSAWNKSPSFFSKTILLMVNPFKKIAGLNALIAGFLVLVSMSYLGTIANVYFLGMLSIVNGVVLKNTIVHPNVFLLLYQNVISWLILATLFMISALLFKRKGIRIIDFLGTVALSRFPFLVLTIFLSIIQIVSPSFLNIDVSKGVQFHPSITISLFGFFVISCFIWQIATFYFALKESSGLVGGKLWISFIVAMLLGETISSTLTIIFF